MSTANYKTMRDFPLITANDTYIKVCPECYSSNSTDADVCENCGHDISGVDTTVDDCNCEYLYKEMQKVADALNEAQPFYTVSVESGYYSGIQFYVEAKYWKLEEFTNEDAREEFDMCRSEMLRKYKVAGNTIRKGLRKAARDFGLDELVCTARFSNGEAWYEKVDPSKPLPVRTAVKAAMSA